MGRSAMLSTAVSVYVPAANVRVFAAPFVLAAWMALIKQATSPAAHVNSAAGVGENQSQEGEQRAEDQPGDPCVR